LNVLSPTLLNPFLEYQDFETPVGIQLTSMLGSSDDQSGFAPLIEDEPVAETSADQLFIPPNQSVNVRSQWSYSDQNFSVPPFRGFATDRSVFYGFPCFMALNNSAAVTATVKFAKDYTGDCPISCDFVTARSKKTVTAASAASATSTAVFSITGNQMDPGGTGKFGLPGLGVRLTNLGNTTQPILSVYIEIVPLANVASSRFVSIPYLDQSTYAKTVDQYRVVAMSNWTQYVGSDLNNGGDIAALTYRAGQSAFETGLYNFKAVASVDESYDGALRFGAYSIWAPSSYSDMSMRQLSSNVRWKLPYIVTCGSTSTPPSVQADALKTEIYTIIEVVSTSQIYDTKQREPNPRAIALASKTLRFQKLNMANGVHLDWIKMMANKAVSLFRSGAQWYNDNRSWVNPAAAALGIMI